MTDAGVGTLVPETDSKQVSLPRCLLVGIVHSMDGVIFTTVADTHSALVEQVADQLRERAEYLLWPDEAERFVHLLDAGEAEAAVALYFENVGARWDQEWLVTEAVDTLLLEEALEPNERSGSARVKGPARR